MTQKLLALALAVTVFSQSVAFASAPTQPGLGSTLDRITGEIAAIEKRHLYDLSMFAIAQARAVILVSDDTRFESMKSSLKESLKKADFRGEARRIVAALPSNERTEALLAATQKDLEQARDRVVDRLDLLSKESLIAVLDLVKMTIDTKLAPKPENEKSVFGDILRDQLALLPSEILMSGIFAAMTVGSMVPVLRPVTRLLSAAGFGTAGLVHWLDSVLK